MILALSSGRQLPNKTGPLIGKKQIIVKLARYILAQPASETPGAAEREGLGGGGGYSLPTFSYGIVCELTKDLVIRNLHYSCIYQYIKTWSPLPPHFQTHSVAPETSCIWTKRRQINWGSIENQLRKGTIKRTH